MITTDDSLAVVIRPARIEDAPALQRNCFPEQTMEEVGEYLAWCLKQAEKGTILRLVGDVGGEVVASAQLTLWGRRAEIGSLMVAEAWRGRGIGSRLILALIGAARQDGASTLEIGVAQHDARTQRLYRRLGFSPSQEANPPVDASAQPVICMVKEL